MKPMSQEDEKTSTLHLDLEVTPPLSLLPLTPKVALPPSLEVTQSLLPLDVVLCPSLGASTYTGTTSMPSSSTSHGSNHVLGVLHLVPLSLILCFPPLLDLP
jgi:hypothetical protein